MPERRFPCMYRCFLVFNLAWWLIAPCMGQAQTSADHGNSRAEATRVGLNTETAGVLEQAGDVDYFQVEVVQAGNLTVETTGATDTVGFLQGGQGQYLTGNDNAGTETNFRIVRDLMPGTYYVAVVGANGRTVTGTYTLAVRFTTGEGGSTADHGNSRPQAARVGLNTETAGALEQAGDVDYFRVEVSQAGQVTVETSGTTDTVGYFGGATGGWLGQDDNTGAEKNFRIASPVTPGTYYVAVVGANGRTATGAYTLAVRFTVGGGTTAEHGNSRAQATLVGLNTETAGALERAGDVDYFRIEVTVAGRLTVGTTGTTDTFGYFGDATGRWLSQNDEASYGDTNFQIVRQVTPGTYYLALVGGNSRRATGAYTFTVQFTAGQAADDHANALERATGVALNTPTAGVLERAGDIDYFRVTITQDGTLTVESTGDTDTYGYLRGVDGRHLGQDDNSGTSQNFQLTRQVVAGTYYVAVVGGNNRSATGAYLLRLRLTSDGDGAGSTATLLDRATVVGINSVTQAELQNGAADYYRVDVTRSGTLTVHTEGPVDTVGVFSPLDNAWFSQDDSGGSGDNFRITQQVTPGTYIIAVRGAYDGDVGRYAFHVAFSSEAGRNTPRVIPVTVGANSITAGELADGAVAYYRIEVPQAGALGVRADSDTDTVGVLWPGNRTSLENEWTNSWDDDGYDRFADFQIAERVSAGTYFVAVSEYVGAYGYSDGNDEDYTLYLHYAATGSAGRGNSILERARSIAPNSDTPGVLAGSQPDYYRIEVPRSGTLTIETTGDTETYGVLSPLGNEWFSSARGGGKFGYTYDSERGTYVQGDYRGEGFEIVQSVSTGTYLVAVVGAYNDTGPYNLRVRFSSGRPTSVRVTPVPIAPNSTTSGSPRASYYRIDVPRAGTLTLSTTGSNGTVGLLLPGNRTPLDNGWLLSWNDGNTGDFRIVERVSAGTYLVIVSEKRGLPYTFQSSFDPS